MEVLNLILSCMGLVQVAAVIIAKKTVFEAKSARDAGYMRASVDERLKDIAKKLGSNAPKSKQLHFPTSLARLPELLFHLRRGPLLGSIIGHEDERAVYRNLYLQVMVNPFILVSECRLKI